MQNMKCYMLHYHYMHWYRIPNFCNFPYSALKHHLHNIKSYFEQGLTKRINLRNTYASFIRAFHLSWKVLLYLFCFLFLFFFSCQKKKSSFQILSKNFLVYHVILLKRCSHITLLEWTLTCYRVIGPCTEILVISQSRKAHAVHAWKFMHNETYISWWSSAFVLCVRWSLRELLPLKF